MRQMLKGKIHRATVTEADLDYEGSVTIDPVLMDAADIVSYEKVQVLDITNGSRLETYAIPGTYGDGGICINGAAAHLVHPGDLVIILTYTWLPEEKACRYKPRIVLVDERNEIRQLAGVVGNTGKPAM